MYYSIPIQGLFTCEQPVKPQPLLRMCETRNSHEWLRYHGIHRVPCLSEHTVVFHVVAPHSLIFRFLGSSY
jgi:hypothetical protein